MRRRTAAAAFLLSLTSAPAAVYAQAWDPAARVIDHFDQTLLAVMKDAKALGPQGRFQRLQPVIVQTFDLPAMTRFAVGSSWSSLSPADQQALVRAFSRMTVATYAHNFDGYSGERFNIDQVETRGPDKLVRTHLSSSGASPTTLTYRMRQNGGNWKVIDVYYNGSVSSIMGQRSEFANTLRTGGAPALVRKLESEATELFSKKS
jgi:phospholipid transport system substrate-binding protein